MHAPSSSPLHTPFVTHPPTLSRRHIAIRSTRPRMPPSHPEPLSHLQTLLPHPHICLAHIKPSPNHILTISYSDHHSRLLRLCYIPHVCILEEWKHVGIGKQMRDAVGQLCRRVDGRWTPAVVNGRSVEGRQWTSSPRTRIWESRRRSVMSWASKWTW